MVQYRYQLGTSGKCSTSCYFDGISVLEHLAIGVGGRMVEAICHRQQNGTACHKNHDKMRKLIRPSRSTAQKNATKKEPIIMCFDHFSLSFLIFHINFPGFLPKSLVFSHHPQPPPRNSSASRVRPALHRRRSPAQLGIGGVRPGGAQAIGDPRRLSLVTVMTCDDRKIQRTVWPKIRKISMRLSNQIKL